MWYRIKLAAMDMGAAPPNWDSVVCQGPDPLDVVAEIGIHLHNALDQMRATQEPGLAGLLFAGVEVEIWDSWNSFVEYDARAEGYRRAMRNYVTGRPSFSNGSPATDTPTTPNGSSPSS